ncbi:MAG TPA: acetyl-CoA C-acetyltransferase, partial [Dongiaceae bacterium]
MSDIVIVAATRTPVGSFSGSLSGLSGAQLGSIVLSSVLQRAKLAAEEVSEVIMGQVLTGATGQNPARQASINAGYPEAVPAETINQVCGSGLRSIAQGYQAILAGDSSIVVAGGQESMTNAVHAMYLRTGTKMGDAQMVDTMIKDGLWDA